MSGAFQDFIANGLPAGADLIEDRDPNGHPVEWMMDTSRMFDTAHRARADPQGAALLNPWEIFPAGECRKTCRRIAKERRARSPPMTNRKRSLAELRNPGQQEPKIQGVECGRK